MPKNIWNVRNRITLPMVASLAFLLAVSLLNIYLFNRDKLTEDIIHETQEFQELLPRQIEGEAKLLIEHLLSVKSNPDIQRAWLKEDREDLLNIAMPVFTSFKDRSKITHFYFIKKDRTCFLRVHNPIRYNDTMDRWTLHKAANNNQISYGIELGPFGTFTLRVVYPWIINGVLSGYIEIGEEIDHLTPILSKTLNVDLVFLINKKFLVREKWEEGLRMMGRKGDWDQLKERVVIDKTIKVIPLEMRRVIDNTHNTQNFTFNLSFAGERRFCKIIPLNDASGRVVGEVILLIDISEQETYLKKVLLQQSLIVLGVSLVLIMLFYRYLGRIEADLWSSHSALNKEIDERKHAEEMLKNYQGQLEEQVKERTENLIKTNTQMEEEIAARKQAERRLKDFNERLEERVAERTLELKEVHETLMRKEKLSALGEMASSVGHELRNPLGVIKNAVYLFNMKKETFKDEAIKQSIDIMNREIESANKIISDLLDFTRVTSPVRISLNLNQLLRAALKKSVIPSEITVVQDLSDNLPSVAVDATQVTQIFLNLIENAVHAMEEGGTLTISTRTANDNVVLNFSDTGFGIPKSNLEKIFEPLFTTRATGTGLGLSICYRLAEANNATIKVKSEEGQGTVFTLSFSTKINP